jgi:hypothetical protein
MIIQENHYVGIITIFGSSWRMRSRFQVLTAVSVEILNFWNVTPGNLLDISLSNKLYNSIFQKSLVLPRGHFMSNSWVVNKSFFIIADHNWTQPLVILHCCNLFPQNQLSYYITSCDLASKIDSINEVAE